MNLYRLEFDNPARILICHVFYVVASDPTAAEKAVRRGNFLGSVGFIGLYSITLVASEERRESPYRLVFDDNEGESDGTD